MAVGPTCQPIEKYEKEKFEKSNFFLTKQSVMRAFRVAITSLSTRSTKFLVHFQFSAKSEATNRT
jgi:hypothetical protein